MEELDELRIKINNIEARVYNTYKAQQKYSFNEYLNLKREIKEEIIKIKRIIYKNSFNNLMISLLIGGFIIYNKDCLEYLQDFL